MKEAQPLATGTPHGTLSAKFLHDLRTPLNQIIGYSDMLGEQAQEEGQTGFAEDLQRIHTAGKKLLSLLDNSASQQPLTEYSISQAEILSTPVAPQTSSAETQALILVVDDIEANRDLLSRRLELQGYSVAMAQNGREALQAVRAQPFDLVLLDIMMPEMDGYAVLQELKDDVALRHIPVIMISALSELDSVVRCIELGAEDYLPKPFEPTLLKARIGSCLEKKRARDRETQLFAQLQQNYKRLQQLEKLRDALMNMIVHDLRTPLTSMIAGMHMVRELGELNDVQKQVVGIALNGAAILQGMITDLLDVEKMESGSMQLDYVVLDVAALVESAVAQVSSLGESEKLALVQHVASDLPPLRADENKLRRILVNLLGNAIKFTPSGGTVTLRACMGEDGESVVFEVSDTGEGIAPESFGLIFEKFGQVESRAGKRTMGTGLGLTFCKLAVEAHGGHIGIHSTPDKGSTFRFTIPLTTFDGANV